MRATTRCQPTGMRPLVKRSSMMPVFDDHTVVGRHGIDPLVVDLHL